MHTQAAAALSEREMGQIKISIGSSLALEGAFGILEDAPNPKPIINNVDVLYINVRTLIRNMMGSIERDRADAAFPEDLAEALLVEMIVIEQAVKSVTSDRVNVQFYLCNYRKLPQRFPHGRLKAATTDKQKMVVLKEENTVISLQERLEDHPIQLIETDIDLPQDPYRVLMLTSYAIDLLQRYRFNALTLLESHTGAAKPPALWYTKLTNGRELQHIPFDRMTLQFFGDGSNLFSGYPIKYRRTLLQIAEKNKWNALTTKDYILSCLKKAHEPELEKVIIGMYRDK